MDSTIVTKRKIVLMTDEIRIAIRKWVEQTHDPLIVFTEGWKLTFDDGMAYIEFDILEERVGTPGNETAPGIQEMLQRGDLDDPGQEDG